MVESPTPAVFQKAMESQHGLVIPTHTADVCVDKIRKALEAGGGFTLLPLSDNRGVVLELSDKDQCLVEHVMLKHPTKQKNAVSPERKWVRDFLSAWRQVINETEVDLVCNWIDMVVAQDGTWEAKFGNGFGEIEFKSWHGGRVAVLTFNEQD